MGCHGDHHGGHKKKDHHDHSDSHPNQHSNGCHGHSNHHGSGHSHGGAHMWFMIIGVGIALAYLFLK
ncbi:hypothetical protein ACQYAD_13170 [Neobacillus sp. SM06]|uniref:hypothetical protein n=1 Tax=Neobacillus sp. SM06 TaxID=3422492 RepID=UPI003D2DE26B